MQERLKQIRQFPSKRLSFQNVLVLQTPHLYQISSWMEIDFEKHWAFVIQLRKTKLQNPEKNL